MNIDIPNIEDFNCRGIYKITNKINNKIYIGSTIKSFKKRYIDHRSKLRAGNHGNIYLQKSFNKYGEENFTFSILKIIEDKNIIRIKEQEEIIKYNTCDDNIGYNLTCNTYCASIDQKVKDKISSTLKNKYKTDKSYKDQMDNMTKNRKNIPVWNKGKKCNNISKTRRSLFFDIEVYDINKNLFKVFPSMIDLIEYSNSEENDLPIIHFNGRCNLESEIFNRKMYKNLMTDKVHRSIRLNIPYKGLFFKKVPSRSDS